MLRLADASIVIDAFRPHGRPEAVARVHELLAARQLATCELVIAEVAHGARDEAEYQKTLADLSSQHVLDPPENAWLRAARLGFELRRKGRTVPLTDLAVAVVAMHHGVPVVHMDRDFIDIATVCDLEQEYVVPEDEE